MAEFRPVSTTVDFPAMERDLLDWWARDGIVEQYLHRNDASETQFSFIDGPITANNPMGVHHAWGRTYKDFFQRYHAMLGKKQRFQNGFDCQGLWVEVEVEKELGLKSKRDIEAYGIAEFVNRCKERVWKYSKRITDQSIRLGYWMDWDDSYYTMSDENNYTIWHFLKTCHERGWIYKGHDVMPWCPRCGTGISEHEIVTEGYQDRTHLSVYVRFPLVDQPNRSLVVWTTTPWTLIANVAAAVNPELTYVVVQHGEEELIVAKDALKTAIKGEPAILAEMPGKDLLGLAYQGPYDTFPETTGTAHLVIPWEDVSPDEGTGIVHIAPGCGREDFGLSKVNDLRVIAPINEFGVYHDGFGWLSGTYVHEVATPIMKDLEERGLLVRAEQYKHRYPVCWRCKTDLVFRLVNEWFITMDPLREPMMDVTRQVNWVPSFGMSRELDWLAHMDDWMISKKRYWGLALPIYECAACDTFEVIGSETELKERAISGWDDFEGHSPHRPWVDAVQIACSTCSKPVSRIKDVGNPWLDAGIVPFSTLDYRHDRSYWEEWYPADLISESFPGQFRNWFYSMIAQGAALENSPAFRNVYSYAMMKDEHGKEMHKSAGNAIWFDDAAERSGVDVMRWLFMTVNPSQNLNFGFSTLDEVRRRFILPLWNSYSFFVTYARLDGFTPPTPDEVIPVAERPLLDRWILSRIQEVTAQVRDQVEAYEPEVGARAIEHFTVEELSNWYIRRTRRRFWKSEADVDKAAAYQTLYEVLTGLTGLIAPFMPFLADEMYQNLVRSFDPAAAKSIHLTDYPQADMTVVDSDLTRDMAAVLDVVALGRSARSAANLKVRQPLAEIKVYARDPGYFDAVTRMSDLVLDELNVKAIEPLGELSGVVSYDIRPNLALLGPKYGKQLPAIRTALAEHDSATIAATVTAGRNLVLNLNGEAIELNPEELLVDLRKQPDLAAAQSADATIVLTTALTPALIAEGRARDFVRGVQDSRRNAGFEIEDHIAITYLADPEIALALQENEEYVMAETLAESIDGQTATGASDQLEPLSVEGPGGEMGADGIFRDQITVGDHQVRIAINKVS